MERLSGLDASFLYLETPQMHMHVAMAAVLDPSGMPGGYSFERVQRLIANRVHRLPPFRRKLVPVPFELDHPLWVDDADFDIIHHVRRVACPAPGSRKELGDICGRINSTPLDRSRPLWEIWVIEGLENGYFAILAKIHHAAIDGQHGAQLLVQLFSLNPAQVEADAPSVIVAERVPTIPRARTRGTHEPLEAAARFRPSRARHVRERPRRRRASTGARCRHRRDSAHRAAHELQRRDQRTPERGLLPREARRREGHQERLRLYGERRRARDQRGCAASLSGRASRAPRDALIAVPVSVSAIDGHAPGSNHVSGMFVVARDERRRSGGASARDPLDDRRREGRASRDRRRHAPELGRARGADDVHARGALLHAPQARGPAPPGAEPRDLERAGPSVPDLSRGREARRGLSDGPCPRGRGTQSHGHELLRLGRLRLHGRVEPHARRLGISPTPCIPPSKSSSPPRRRTAGEGARWACRGEARSTTRSTYGVDGSP